jgi:hypothetical protein
MRDHSFKGSLRVLAREIALGLSRLHDSAIALSSLSMPGGGDPKHSESKSRLTELDNERHII